MKDERTEPVTAAKNAARAGNFAKALRLTERIECAGCRKNTRADIREMKTNVLTEGNSDD